jgi:hypothetical protein
VLSIAEAARSVLAKLPRLHVERLAIDNTRGRVRGVPVAGRRGSQATKAEVTFFGSCRGFPSCFSAT